MYLIMYMIVIQKGNEFYRNIKFSFFAFEI